MRASSSIHPEGTRDAEKSGGRDSVSYVVEVKAK